jgi:hypothetical protein
VNFKVSLSFKKILCIVIEYLNIYLRKLFSISITTLNAYDDDVKRKSKRILKTNLYVKNNVKKKYMKESVKEEDPVVMIKLIYLHTILCGDSC